MNIYDLVSDNIRFIAENDRLSSLVEKLQKERDEWEAKYNQLDHDTGATLTMDIIDGYKSEVRMLREYLKVSNIEVEYEIQHAKWRERAE